MQNSECRMQNKSKAQHRFAPFRIDFVESPIS